MSDLAVLHALALRKKSDLEGLEASTGMPRAEIEGVLAAAIEDGRVVAARGTHLLSPKGSAWLLERYPEEFAAYRSDAALAEEYERFETVNRELKSLITRWQTRSVGGKSLPNDHADEEYDAAVLDRLADLHERAEALIGRLALEVPRLGRYADRLGDALERAEAGGPEAAQWVSGVRCDSYHMVWFEMHEDLLRLLGRKREE